MQIKSNNPNFNSGPNIGGRSQVNKLENRIDKFRNRFELSKNKYNNLHIKLKSDLIEQKKLVKNLDRIDQNPDNLYKELLSNLKKIRWSKISLKRNFESKLEMDLANAKNYAESIQIDLDWITNINKEKINSESNKLKGANIFIKNHSKKSIVLSEQLDELQRKYDKTSDILDVLYSAEKYLTDPKRKLLRGLNKKITQKDEELLLLNNVSGIYSKINIELFKDEKRNINEYFTSINKNIYKYEKKQISLEHKIKIAKEDLTQKERILGEIKYLGMKIIESNPKITECPLCKAQHPVGELNRLVQKIEKVSDEELKSLKSELDSIIKNISKLNFHNSQLKLLQEVVEYLDPNLLIKENPIFKISIQIGRELKRINVINSQLNKLILMQSYFKEKNLKEDEYTQLIQNLKIWKVRVNKPFKELIHEFYDKILTYGATITSVKNSKKKIDKSINREYSLIGIDVHEVELLIERIKKLEMAEFAFDELSAIFPYGSRTQISNVEIRIDKITEQLKIYQDSVHKREENNIRRSSADKNIKKLNDEINRITPLKQNAQKAHNLLNELMKNHSKPRFIQEFLSDNIRLISNIFKSIHTPNEFSEINFDKDKILLNTQKNLQVKLTEISSGQRSALALSLFQVLNMQLKNGPNIMIFDEPIANVDELNVLTFLDYLRDLIVNSDRQLFFATASENLAFLFEKKFAFLPVDEFRKYELKRSIGQE